MSDANERYTRLLADLGYSLSLRRDGFVEVLVARDDERWLGRGVDPAAALDDAVRRMFPSHAARVALEGLWGRAPFDGPAGDRVEAETASETTSETASETASEAASETTSETASAPQDPETPPTVAALPASSSAETPDSEPAPGSGAREDEVERDGAGEDSPVESPSPPPQVVLAPESTVAELEAIVAEVAEAEADIAVMSPRLCQLHMLAWLCRAREYQSVFARDRHVRRSVTKIASSLGRLANLYWPGSVPALRADATPSAIVRVLELTAAPAGWGEASDAAERCLARTAAEPGLDADGWRDRSSLQPRPADPQRMLERIDATLAQMFGPLDQAHDRSLEATLRALPGGSTARLAELAAQLRWLRLGVEDDIRWGRLMGRLRWAAHKLGDSRLQRAVDPDTRPSTTWAQQLTAGTKKAQRERRRAALAATRPRAGHNDEPAALFRWLVDAFPVFDTDELVALVAGVRDPIMALDDDDIAALKRGHRRRFATLRRKLQAGESGSAVEVDPSAADGEDDDDGAVAAESQPDPGEVLMRRVRAQVEGRPTLFVSNRDDPTLKRSIEETFGLKIDWCDASRRRVQSAVTRIEQGRYELVIAATGFMSHTTEQALAPACKVAGIPYARAYRGRPLACGRAIATAMGIAGP